MATACERPFRNVASTKFATLSGLVAYFVCIFCTKAASC